MSTPLGKSLLQRSRKFGDKMYMPAYVANTSEDADKFVKELRKTGFYARKYKLTSIERESVAFPPVHESPVRYIIYARR